MAAPDAPAAGAGLVFDDEFLRKLERLELLARKMFRGLLRGEHATPRRGRGLEFSDFRHYRPGDDFRHIDWNIYSRLDQLFLKLHASEEDLTLHLLEIRQLACGRRRQGSDRREDRSLSEQSARSEKRVHAVAGGCHRVGWQDRGLPGVARRASQQAH